MREYTYSSFFENDNQRERGGGEASSASLSPSCMIIIINEGWGRVALWKNQ
jgi:uncharacterized spore protein YtfJ